MYFFTHLFMAKVLYEHFADEVNLDKRAFSYGNIKPDLPSSIHIPHTLENCLTTVSGKLNYLLEEVESTEDFSETLGEICHYVCDFCCYYHLGEELYNKKLHHFLYELKLHWTLNKKRYILAESKKPPVKDISSIILRMRKTYITLPRSMQKDIDFAFTSAVWTCESIIYFIRYSVEMANDTEAELYSF